MQFICFNIVLCLCVLHRVRLAVVRSFSRPTYVESPKLNDQKVKGQGHKITQHCSRKSVITVGNDMKLCKHFLYRQLWTFILSGQIHQKQKYIKNVVAAPLYVFQFNLIKLSCDRLCN